MPRESSGFVASGTSGSTQKQLSNRLSRFGSLSGRALRRSSATGNFQAAPNGGLTGNDGQPAEFKSPNQVMAEINRTINGAGGVRRQR